MMIFVYSSWTMFCKSLYVVNFGDPRALVAVWKDNYTHIGWNR